MACFSDFRQYTRFVLFRHATMKKSELIRYLDEYLDIR